MIVAILLILFLLLLLFLEIRRVDKKVTSMIIVLTSPEPQPTRGLRAHGYHIYRRTSPETT